MARGLCLLLGAGLIVLGLVAGNTPNVTWGFVWLDLVIGIFSIYLGAIVHPRPETSSHAGWPFLFGLCLIAAWLMQVTSGSSQATAWWNFGFAIGYFLTSATARSRRARTLPAEYLSGTHPPESEQERERRVG